MSWPLDHPVAVGGWCMLVGLVFVSGAGFYLLRGIRSRSWPRVAAYVANTKAVQDSDGDWSVEVTYAYSIEGRNFQRTEDLKKVWPTRENAAAVEAEFSRGTEISVWFDPEKPSVAVMKQGTTLNLWLWLLIGVAAFAAGACSVLEYVLQF